MRLATLAILAGLLLSGCDYTEWDWVRTQDVHCGAMGGTGYWNQTEHTYECYRHPIGRMTKRLFSEKYEGKP